VLFGKLRPYFRKVGIAPVGGVCSTDIVVISPPESTWRSFVALVASSTEFVAFTNQSSTGTKMPRTSWPEMSRYPVAMPRPHVAACFERLTRPSLERIVSLVHESRTLAALRDTLLPKLISGEIRVKDAERVLEAIV
jgi:type I restriction enzyme S subunit